MSGLEVAGVVLGTIPLVISVLKSSQAGYGTLEKWKHCTEVLNGLIRQLDNEKTILKNTCMWLLRDVVSSSCVREMVKEPFGPLWGDQEVKRKLAWKLGTSLETFKNNVEHMSSCLDKISRKLESEGEGGEMTKKKFTKSPLGRIALAIREPKYREMVASITTANSGIARLLDSHSKVSDSSRAHHQVTIFSKVRTVAHGIYNALRFSFSCGCPVAHGINLQLFEPSILQDWNLDPLNPLTGELYFRFALSYDTKKTDKGKGKRICPWNCNEISLRLADTPGTNNSSSHPPPPPMPNSVGINSKTDNFIKRIREILRLAKQNSSKGESRQSTGNPPTISQAIQAVSVPQPPDLFDLCQVLALNEPHDKSECYGYIKDHSSAQFHKFGVYRVGPQTGAETWLTVSLKDLLDSGVFRNHVEGPRRPQQLQMAAKLASSVLQLHSTPWMSLSLRNDDIYFLQSEDGNVDYDRIFVAKRFMPKAKARRVFISRRLMSKAKVSEENNRVKKNRKNNKSRNKNNHLVRKPDDRSARSQLLSSGEIRNPTIFLLAELLIEIILRKPLEDLCSQSLMNSEAGIDSNGSSSNGPITQHKQQHPLRNRSTKQAVLDEVEDAGYETYREVVRRCLDCDFICSESSLDNQTFKEEVYTHIVSPLQRNAELSRRC